MAQPGRRGAAHHTTSGDEWWRHFDDPVLDQLVTEAQRLNPGVRTAGIRIMEARAQLGIAGSALYPQLQQVSSQALLHRQSGQQRPGYDVRVVRPGLRPGLGTGLLGQVQARHRVGRCRLLREYRAVRRRAGAGRRPGGEPVRIDPHHRVAAAHRARERGDPGAQPGDHRAAVPQRQRRRARRAAGPLAVPEHPGDDPRTRERPAPDTQRAVRAAGAAARRAAGVAARARQDPRSAARGDRRRAGRAAAAPARRARGRDAAGRAIGADRHQRGGAVSVHRARRVRWVCRPRPSVRPAPRSPGPSDRRSYGTCSITGG